MNFVDRVICASVVMLAVSGLCIDLLPDNLSTLALLGGLGLSPRLTFCLAGFVDIGWGINGIATVAAVLQLWQIIEEGPVAKKLTSKQLSTLAEQLRGTQGNVYTLSQELFGVEAGNVFDQLKVEQSLFRCEFCDVWQHTDDESTWCADRCVRCAEQLDEDDDDG